MNVDRRHRSASRAKEYQRRQGGYRHALEECFSVRKVRLHSVERELIIAIVIRANFKTVEKSDESSEIRQAINAKYE